MCLTEQPWLGDDNKYYKKNQFSSSRLSHKKVLQLHPKHIEIFQLSLATQAGLSIMISRQLVAFCHK